MPVANMQRDERDLLDVLKFELNFLEKGGYGRSVRTPWKPEFIFEDSPSCFNYDSKDNKASCSDCVLMQLLSTEGRAESVPCRHIPLNEEGETLHTLYGRGFQHETEEVFGKWLREAIARIESEREVQRSKAKASPPHHVVVAHGITLRKNVHPKCTNPACPTGFHWLIGGKFFRFGEKHCETCAGKSSEEQKCSGRYVKHFWLCEQCSSIFTLAYDEGSGVMLKPRCAELPAKEARKMLFA
jgi:hypothetical protein